MWDSDIFPKSSSWDTCGMLRGVLINVYAPCSHTERLRLWDTIRLVIDQNREACICVVGDLNAILFPKEREGRGEAGDSRDMFNFDDFISQCNLMDMPLSGRSFTWYRPDGTCKSKLDRILVNLEWITRWPNQVLKGLNRSLSDHCPIFMESARKDWGPRPFRFINAWVKHPKFKEFFEAKWSNYQVHGWAAFRLKEKLKRLRSDLKVWNREVFGVI
ncbi:hypothetical protein ACS0TY_017854 [Phlomoides rotata]